MDYNPVLVGSTTKGQRVEVVDLTPIYFSRREDFDRLFGQAQRIYNYSFPDEEREPGHVVRFDYIEPAAAAMQNGTIEYGDGTFSYLVPVIDGRAKGMVSYDLVLTEGGFSLTFEGYIAVAKRHRHTGVGTMLVDALARNAMQQAEERGLDDVRYNILEVEKPRRRITDPMRDAIRPDFHHKSTKAGALALIDRAGRVELAPYAQPGIKKKGMTYPKVPLVFSMARIDGGSMMDLGMRTGIVDKNGRLAGDALEVDKNDAYHAVGGIISAYLSEPDVYSEKQVVGILEDAQRAIERSHRAILVPIPDTKYMRQP